MIDPSRPPLVVVVGPTAAGKTSLAIELAHRVDGELVGADAYQVYRGMDIGTSKPTAAELDGIAHHLVDVADPDEHFDAHRYMELADAAVAGVAGRARAAIVVGGTGLYARALVRGLAAMPGADPELRRALSARAELEGVEALHRELAASDPAYAAMIGSRDLVRITRALEVLELTGLPISELHDRHRRRPDRYDSLWLGLDPGPAALRVRIERRTAAMFEAGFVAEVRRLLDRGYSPELPPMRALGYRAACRHVAGEISLDDAAQETVRDTARYARRQRNWFRSEARIHWVEALDHQVIARVRSHLDARRQS
jgi:tRNA dimethylallyltransferase